MLLVKNLKFLDCFFLRNMYKSPRETFHDVLDGKEAFFRN